MNEYFFELVDEIFFLVMALCELRFEEFEAEEVNVEELLEEGVDVADGVRIPEAHSALELHVLRQRFYQEWPSQPLLLLRLFSKELQ